MVLAEVDDFELLEVAKDVGVDVLDLVLRQVQVLEASQEAHRAVQPCGEGKGGKKKRQIEKNTSLLLFYLKALLFSLSCALKARALLPGE